MIDLPSTPVAPTQTPNPERLQGQAERPRTHLRPLRMRRPGRLVETEKCRSLVMAGRHLIDEELERFQLAGGSRAVGSLDANWPQFELGRTSRTRHHGCHDMTVSHLPVHDTRHAASPNTVKMRHLEVTNPETAAQMRHPERGSEIQRTRQIRHPSTTRVTHLGDSPIWCLRARACATRARSPRLADSAECVTHHHQGGAR